ncbi:MAG: hypothetical protein J0L92_10435 [Deltaproteobacteria bacterium]|nr:hypothetical protein [Deltaproteobacteria bacterium]
MSSRPLLAVIVGLPLVGLTIVGLGLLGNAGCGGADARPQANQSTTSRGTTLAPAPPDLAQLRALLEPLHGHTFTNEERDERGCPPDQDLGAYLAMLDQNTAPDPSEPGRVNERTGGCDVPTEDAMWPEPDPAYWLCTVSAYTRDAGGESPWHYELRVRVRRSDGAIDPSWIACPGMP